MRSYPSIEELIEKMRLTQTPADKLERQLAFTKRMAEYEAERVKRNTCSDCGVDTGKYSHTFNCRWRGIL